MISEIEAYTRKCGGNFGDWFIGIADNPIGPHDEAFLHNKVERGLFLYMEAPSSGIARAVADFFADTRGMNSNPDEHPAKNDCRAVYLYKKAVPPVRPIESAYSPNAKFYRLKNLKGTLYAPGPQIFYRSSQEQEKSINNNPR